MIVRLPPRLNKNKKIESTFPFPTPLQRAMAFSPTGNKRRHPFHPQRLSFLWHSGELVSFKRKSISKIYVHTQQWVKIILLWASRHHRATLLCAEVRDGSIKHIDLVEEVDGCKAFKPSIITLQFNCNTSFLQSKLKCTLLVRDLEYFSW